MDINFKDKNGKDMSPEDFLIEMEGVLLEEPKTVKMILDTFINVLEAHGRERAEMFLYGVETMTSMLRFAPSDYRLIPDYISVMATQRIRALEGDDKKHGDK